VKLTKRQLRQIINEEAQRLHELHPGSNMSSYVKQGIAKLWEADNLFQRAMSEAGDQPVFKALEAVHKALENMAFQVDGKMQRLVK
jgi:hypothetical protein